MAGEASLPTVGSAAWMAAQEGMGQERKTVSLGSTAPPCHDKAVGRGWGTRQLGRGKR